MRKRVQVKMDLQFEVDTEIAVLREIATTVRHIIYGDNDDEGIKGSVSIEGAIEQRRLFGVLQDNWLAKADENTNGRDGGEPR